MKNRQIITVVVVVVVALGVSFWLKHEPAIDGIVDGVLLEDLETKPIPTSVSHKDLIILESPLPGDVITSPLEVRGKARGKWFFEASFPLTLTDWDGLIIAQSYSMAQDEWMTEDYVPFVGTLTFEKPAYGDRGALILHKDNPSGLPEHDDALEITVCYNPDCI